ncbi:ADP-ribosylation factor-like protein 6-interacting protein 1 [Euwallacea fornicatus]|uniref:ADP-ribosylation factor-like protein 6-interacting protein 1 n=1 Tax=Euwallacea fornicatus TaxID=995702 RepID=UPI00338D593F
MSDKEDLCFQPSRALEACYSDQETFAKTYFCESLMNVPLSTPSFSSDYKISPLLSMETQIRKLKLSMEPWRELVLFTNKLLLWERNFYATGLLAGTTVLFTLILFCDPNVLTIISLIGIAITLSDYFIPIILNSVFRSETWTPEKQKEYEEICTNIILYKTKSELLISSFCRMRVTNPKLYFGVTISTLIVLAWLGSTVDNLLLSYITVSFFVMLPGMQHHGKLKNFSKTFSKLFNELVENAKVRVGQKKSQ